MYFNILPMLLAYLQNTYSMPSESRLVAQWSYATTLALLSWLLLQGSDSQVPMMHRTRPPAAYCAWPCSILGYVTRISQEAAEPGMCRSALGQTEGGGWRQMGGGNNNTNKCRKKGFSDLRRAADLN